MSPVHGQNSSLRGEDRQATNLSRKHSKTSCSGAYVAFLLATDYEPCRMPVIAAIAVAPEHRRRRYGQLLLHAATRALVSQRYSRCCAMISPGNAASEALFASIGFHEAQQS
jgi:N-acetylglutamate synthase-like GNAT family acetyltransferase